MNRWTPHGRHEGKYRGLAPIGKSLTFTGITIFRIAKGKIIEQWVQQDMLGFMQLLRLASQHGDMK